MKIWGCKGELLASPIFILEAITTLDNYLPYRKLYVNKKGFFI
jgi:hypothetical protein